jgi:hypothetical protein
MFTAASLFDEPYNNWSVSNVTEMDSMSFDASAFDQLLDTWNASNVVSADNMFFGTFSFSEDTDFMPSNESSSWLVCDSRFGQGV